jgi:hypothetical protein
MIEKNGKQEEKTEPFGDPIVATKPMANVGFSVGATIPGVMGPYSSVKYTVSLYLPCEIGEIDQVFAFEKEWLDEKVNALIQETKENS